MNTTTTVTVDASQVRAREFENLRVRLNALFDFEHNVDHFSMDMEQRTLLREDGRTETKNVGVLRMTVSGSHSRRRTYTARFLREAAEIFRADRSPTRR